VLELSKKKGGSRYKMRRNRGIKKIVIFVLLSVLAFGNTIPYQQFVQKNRQMVKFIISLHLVSEFNIGGIHK
jgi:hypothetical protein